MREKEVSAVITIEMSFLIPMILSLFVSVMYCIFYYHDKNIILGAAVETAVIGAQMERKPDEKGTVDLSHVYEDRVSGKLILFSHSSSTYNVSKKQVEVCATAQKGLLRIQTCQRAPVLHPETVIRRKRMMEGILEEKQEEKHSEKK